MPKVAFWTRNLERNGFRINGFINDCPDFIIQSKSGKTIVLETKGGHLDAEKNPAGESVDKQGGEQLQIFYGV